MAGHVIHGLNAVREVMASGRRINRLYFAKESRAKGFEELLDDARAKAIPFDFVPQAKLNQLTRSREHQGVAAAISPVEYTSLDACLTACPAQATLLVLDHVQHPKNLGLLIRTAVGAGAAGLLIAARGGALLDESVVRASAGAVFNIPIVSSSNLAQTMRRLKEADFWIYGLEAKASQDVFEVDWPERCALIVGNETTGLRPGLRKTCDALVAIPLEGKLDSLNVAVAAGVALFQITSRRRSTAQG